MSRPHLLELFSGTKSIGNVFRENGWSVTSVDLDAKFQPTICVNVLHLTPEMIGEPPHTIWGSPPCTMYSRARTTAKTPSRLRRERQAGSEGFGPCKVLWGSVLHGEPTGSP